MKEKRNTKIHFFLPYDTEQIKTIKNKYFEQTK